MCSVITYLTLALFIYTRLKFCWSLKGDRKQSADSVKSFYVKQVVLKAFLKGRAWDMDYTGHSLVLNTNAPRPVNAVLPDQYKMKFRTLQDLFSTRIKNGISETGCGVLLPTDEVLCFASLNSFISLRSFLPEWVKLWKETSNRPPSAGFRPRNSYIIYSYLDLFC